MKKKVESEDKKFPKVEVRIPISANEKFMRMLHYLVVSMEEFGGELLSQAHVVVSVSRDELVCDLSKKYPWTQEHSIEFRWIDEELFQRHEYDGTGLDRFYVESDADIIIMCDADILVANSIDDIILKSHEEQKQLGFIAHASPFNTSGLSDIPSSDWWARVFKSANLPIPESTQKLTGVGLIGLRKNADHDYCPPYYFNYGFIISPRWHVEKMRGTFEQDIKNVDSVISTIMKSQIVNTLSYTRHNLNCGNLTINYNFPLHIPEDNLRKLNFDETGGNRPEDIRIFHYCGFGAFNPNDFKSEQTLLEALTRRDLSPSHRQFQKRLLFLHNRVGFNKQYGAKLNRVVKDSNSSNRTFLISGGRRTGTTLLAAIFCSDPRANPLGQEAQFFTKLQEAFHWSSNHFDQFGVSFFENIEVMRSVYKQMLDVFIEHVADFSSNGVLVLKNPELCFYLEDIYSLCDEFSLLATVRDPRDQIASELEVGKRRIASGTEDNRCVMRNISAYTKSYLSYLEKIVDFKEKHPDRLKIIRYEDLVLKTDEILRELEFETDLNFAFERNSEWRRVSEDAGLHGTPSASDLYGLPVSAKSIGRYKTDLSKDEIDQIESECFELMEFFNYNHV